MILLTDLEKIGPALASVRELLGISRRQIARQIAELTGRSETSVNAQIWEWDNGRRRPDLYSMRYLLDALGMDLALVEKPSQVRTWPRLVDPLSDVRKVRVESGLVFTRMLDGYWSAPGWNYGVEWAQLLRWGPVEEVKDEEAVREDQPQDPGRADSAGGVDGEAARG